MQQSPYPQKGDIGKGCNRSGQSVCKAEVVELKTAKAFDQTALLTIKVPEQFSEEVRFFKW